MPNHICARTPTHPRFCITFSMPFSSCRECADWIHTCARANTHTRTHTFFNDTFLMFLSSLAGNAQIGCNTHAHLRTHTHTHDHPHADANTRQGTHFAYAHIYSHFSMTCFVLSPLAGKTQTGYNDSVSALLPLCTLCLALQKDVLSAKARTWLSSTDLIMSSLWHESCQAFAFDSFFGTLAGMLISKKDVNICVIQYGIHRASARDAFFGQLLECLLPKHILSLVCSGTVYIKPLHETHFFALGLKCLHLKQISSLVRFGTKRIEHLHETHCFAHNFEC